MQLLYVPHSEQIRSVQEVMGWQKGTKQSKNAHTIMLVFFGGIDIFKKNNNDLFL